MAETFMALVLNLRGPSLEIHPVFKNERLIYFKTSEEAEKYVKKNYDDYYIFFGLIDDPRPYYKAIRKERGIK